MMGYLIAGAVLVTFAVSLALTVGILYFLGSTLVARNGGSSNIARGT